MGAGADVIIIGAGAIGCACALRLAQAGASVLVVERGEPGAESSWAAAGILGAQMESTGQGPLLELCLASRELHGALAEELRAATGIDVAYARCGVLELAFDPVEERALRARASWQRAAGLRVESLDPAALAARGASERAIFGLFFPDDGRVDNRALARALREAATFSGARFLRGEASRIVVEEGKVRGARVGKDELAAPTVVVAAGSWSALLPGAGLADDSVRPVRGQMISLALDPLPFDAVLVSSTGYAVPRRDRVLVGATVEEVGFDKSLTPGGMAQMRAVASRLSAALAEAPLLEHWAGLRPGSRDGLPFLGRPLAGPEGLIVATGHFRNGILLSAITGEIVGALALGRAPPLDLSPFRPDRTAAPGSRSHG